MKNKLRVGILFGGRSGEHEVSLLSAASILKAIDRKRYDVVPIAIDKQGRWLCGDQALRLLASPAPAPLSAASEDDLEFATAAAVLRCGEPLQIPPPHPMRRATDRLERSTGAHLAQPGNPLAASLDVVFPVLHGTFGEDGTIQGLFELADIAYVGSGVLGSSAAMDKDAMKRLFAAAGLPQTPHIALLRSQWRADPKRATRLIEKSLRYPLFVKPANLGSSVGISKVHARSELAAAINLAARFDRKLIVERGVGGPGVKPREFEVAVLGNDAPQASVVGEIVPNREFYDYDSKYADSPEDPSIP
ncbi:MAG: D-alanine--D-alanine ligase family protein, partial [Acidobacteriaceae bacterium]